MKEGGDTCDWYLQEVDGICDPFVKIYVNGHVDRTTDVEKNTNTKIYTSKYRTEKIPKDSKITFEMWDDDSPFSPDLLLRKTLSIDELTKDFWVIFVFSFWSWKYEFGEQNTANAVDFYHNWKYILLHFIIIHDILPSKTISNYLIQ